MRGRCKCRGFSENNTLDGASHLPGVGCTYVNFIVSLVERLFQKSDELCRVDPPAVNILTVVDIVVGRRVGTAGVCRFERRTLTVARHC